MGLVATQNEELRKRFHGRSEYLVNFFTFLAQEVREYLAEMGFTKIVSRSVLGTREEPSNAERQQKEKRKEKSV